LFTRGTLDSVVRKALTTATFYFVWDRCVHKLVDVDITQFGQGYFVFDFGLAPGNVRGLRSERVGFSVYHLL